MSPSIIEREACLDIPCSSNTDNVNPPSPNKAVVNSPHSHNIHSKHQKCHSTPTVPVSIHNPAQNKSVTTFGLNTTSASCYKKVSGGRYTVASKVSISETLNPEHSLHFVSHAHTHSHNSGHSHAHTRGHIHARKSFGSRYNNQDQILGILYSRSDSRQCSGSLKEPNVTGSHNDTKKAECRCAVSKRRSSNQEHGSSKHSSSHSSCISSSQIHGDHHRQSIHIFGYSQNIKKPPKQSHEDSSINPSDNDEVLPASLPSVPPPPPPPQRSPIHSHGVQPISNATPSKQQNPTAPLGPPTKAQKRRAKAIMVDRFSRVFFPSTFGLINAVYWVIFWLYL